VKASVGRDLVEAVSDFLDAAMSPTEPKPGWAPPRTAASEGPTVVCGVDGLDHPTTQSLRGLLVLPFATELHAAANPRRAEPR
jgi:hypothetical protein